MTADSDSLAGRTAIVTGGAGGIGASISVRLAKMGANVVIAQRSADRPAQVVDRIEELGGDAMHVATDMGVDEDIVNVVEEAVDEFGGAEVIVHAATHKGKAPVAEMSREVFEGNLSVTLTGLFRLAQEAYPHMQEAGFGRIVTIGAIQAHSPYPDAAGYASAKAGLEGLTRTIATDWGTGEADITANLVHVGATPKGHNWEDYDEPLEEANDIISEESASGHPHTLVNRQGRPSDHAELVAYLVSPASGYMTGEVLTLDGGRLTSRFGSY